jgi:mRNA-degrading endonuclease YafQ of YafQ-DinJ toxin-antitoxin module
MKQVKSGRKFRKDLKRYINKPEKLEKLYNIVGLLQKGEPVPKENKPHMLAGNYAGIWSVILRVIFF